MERSTISTEKAPQMAEETKSTKTGYNRKWFEKSKTKANTFTLNWIGESEVGKMGRATKP
jgi:hypothetical protein